MRATTASGVPERILQVVDAAFFRDAGFFPCLPAFLRYSLASMAAADGGAFLGPFVLSLFRPHTWQLARIEH